MTNTTLKSATLVFAAAFAVGIASAQPKVGKPVPTFKMTDLAGKIHTPASLKGKVVLLDFWATWCGPCKMASPAMNNLQKKFGNKLMVIGANVWDGTPAEGKSKAAGYKKEHGYVYSFTYGNDNLAKAWGVRGIPYFVLIDKNGTVAYINDKGYSNSLEGELSKRISSLVK